MKILQKKLSFFYYSVFILAFFLMFCGYFLNKNGFIVTNNLIVDNFKFMIIVYMLIIIPLSFKSFSVKTKKIAQITNENEKFAKYLSIAKSRIALISIIFWVGIIAFFIINIKDFLYIAAIGIVALIFCKPTINKIEHDLFIEENE